MTDNTPCIRCGKIRIEAKTWTEQVGNSMVTYTNTVCPDPECQKIVESQLQKRQDKLMALRRESDRRRGRTKELWISKPPQAQKSPTKSKS